MKKNLKLILITLIILLYSFFYKFFILKHFLIHSEMITTCFLLLITFISYLLFGIQKNKFNRLKIETTSVILITTVFYMVIIYFLGLLTGYLKNSYNLSFISIIKNISWPLLIIIITELLRYILIRNNKDNKLLFYLLFLTLTILDIMINVNFDFTSTDMIFRTITSKIIPIIFKEYLLTYTAKEISLLPNLFYRIITELYIYIIPIVPDLGDYIYTMVNILLPIIINSSISRMINEYYNGIEREFNTQIITKYDIPFLLLTTILVLLISGIFKYQIIGVTSISMQPYINKGDGVIVDKTYTEIKEGDIIAYRNNDIIIIHRVISIKKNEETDEIIYSTKGDYNNTEDGVKLLEDDIVGKVILRVPYIAYPSIYFHQLID